MILLPSEALADNYADSNSWKTFPRTVVLAGDKRSRTISAGAKYDRQSPQEAKTCGLPRWYVGMPVCHIYM